MNLKFVAAWYNKDKNLSWSGTTYALLKELQKHFNVELLNVRLYKVVNILRKLNMLSNDFDISVIKNERQRLNRKVKSEIVFQFAEHIEKPGLKTFIYQDLSVSYLLYMYLTNKHELKYSGFGGYDIKYVKQRAILQNHYYETCSGIFTMGRWLSNFLINECGLPKDKVHHVGGGYNINLDKKEEKRESRRILFVGRDFIRKGGVCVVEAFKILHSKKVNTELYIAGPKENPLEENIEGIVFLGDLPHDKLDYYFSLCDIFCLPSYFEAYGLVFIEALCAGMPCIGRRAYEMQYFIEENETGYLIDNDNSEFLAGKMEDLLQNERIKKNVKEKREYYKREYSWETVGKRIRNVIENSIKSETY